jgi:hypothetical protein
MAVKKSQRGANNGETDSEAQLAPPAGKKESAPLTQSRMDDGTLDVNTGDLKLPQELAEEEEAETTGLLSVDPAVIVILCFSLVFIAVIAFVIWNGWEPPR